MPGTVDDFIQRFGNDKKTMDENEASQFIDRFADPNDSDFDTQTMASGATEYLGRLPDPDFQYAARNAYTSASPQQQQGLVGTLMRALQNRGVNLGSVLGQTPNDPSRVDASQYAQMANYARQQHPDAIREVVQEQPWIMKAMGNPVLMGALGMMASRMIKNRMGSRQAPQSDSGGGLLGKLF